MIPTEIGRPTIGQNYREHLMRMVQREGRESAEDVELGSARVEAFVTDPVFRRELVLYVALEGPEKGRLLVRTLASFVGRYRPIAPAPETAPVEMAPAKSFGHVSTGNPW